MQVPETKWLNKLGQSASFHAHCLRHDSQRDPQWLIYTVRDTLTSEGLALVQDRICLWQPDANDISIFSVRAIPSHGRIVGCPPSDNNDADDVIDIDVKKPPIDIPEPEPEGGGQRVSSIF